ncbi:MAG: RNA 2',3'-cyclic phosphodiesterase [Gemmatimonadota bacterium]|nr:MAG: RNA 2',3'-cyclic phosphodiesterase [Gemmatimonadota bacterium]
MRLFVAMNLPDDVRQSMWTCATPLREQGFPIKWVGPDSIHLTLKFLGEVDRQRVGELRERIDGAAAGVAPFELPLSGFGAFPNPRRARVIWVGCDAVTSLKRIQEHLESEMRDAGFPRETRAFRPHLTLGRVRRDTRPQALAGLSELLQRLHFDSRPVVESVDLMQSQLSRSGATYTRLHAASLSAI